MLHLFGLDHLVGEPHSYRTFPKKTGLSRGAVAVSGAARDQARRTLPNNTMRRLYAYRTMPFSRWRAIEFSGESTETVLSGPAGRLGMAMRYYNPVLWGSENLAKGAARKEPNVLLRLEFEGTGGELLDRNNIASGAEGGTSAVDGKVGGKTEDSDALSSDVARDLVSLNFTASNVNKIKSRLRGATRLLPDDEAYRRFVD